MKTSRGPAGRGVLRRSRIASRPLVERFEDRLLLAVFEVTNTANAGAGSLRQAIIDSNGSTMGLPNRIEFDSLPSGLQTFIPDSPLPMITQQVVIDGATAAAYNPANPRPSIEIRGDSPLLGAGPAFTITSPNVTLRALAINSFDGAGVVVNGGGDRIEGCFIGLAPSGQTAARNTGEGITVSSANNTIGGTTPAQRNVISSNLRGVHITGTTAIGNLVQGNFIGTNADGTASIRNTFAGVEVNTQNNTIGGSTTLANGIISGAGNVISGNQTGVSISGNLANGNAIQGNFIGTDATGLGAIPNIFDGLDLVGVRNTQVGVVDTPGGTPDPTLANVISANGFDGIEVSSATAFNNRIQGNIIGAGVNGTTPLGNGVHGVFVNGANNTLIGGAVQTTTLSRPELGNVIAFNGPLFSLNPGNGVLVLGGANSGQNNGILSNRIFANLGLGIRLSGGNQGVIPPTVVSVQSGAAQTRVAGAFNDPRFPNTAFRIQFFGNQTPDPLGSGEGMDFLGDLNVVTDSQGNANFTTVLFEGVPVGNFVTATATQGVTVINNTSQFSPATAVTQAQVTDLGVSIAVPTTPPLLNQLYTYTVTVRNNGPNDATNVVLTDTIPASATFVSSSAGQVFGQVLTAPIGNLAANSSVDVTITVRPTTVSGAFINTATVTGDELDTDLTNNTATTTAAVASNADLSAVLTVGTNPAPVGSPITYALVVSNNGPSTANNATATVTLPASLADVVVTPDQGTFTLNGNILTLNLGILPASTGSTITITGTPTATGTITTSVVVSSALSDPNTANNSASVDVLIANAADLALTLTTSANPVLVGQEFFYTIVVTNVGPSRATSPTVIDQLPAGLTFVAADSSAGGSGTLSISNNVIRVDLAPLDPGASAVITIAVIPTVSGQVVNTASVFDPDPANPVEIDPDATNNTATTVTQVSPADLGVTIFGPADPLLIGSPAVFQVVVTNNGPAAANNVILTDAFGPNAIITGSSAGTATGGRLVVNLGTLAGGASTTVTIVATPTGSGTLLNSAFVSADEVDPDPNNNSSTSSNLVGPVDLAVTVTASPNPVLLGGQVVYVVTVTNNGPTTATNVLFNDILPAGAVLNSATSSQGAVAPSSAGSVTGNLGTLAPGASATVVILVTTGSVSTATDTASVSSDGFDINNLNDAGSASVSVIDLPGAIVVGTPILFVSEDAGFATITLNRLSGTLGTVTVDFATADFTAVGGVNYTPTSGTVTFLPGQTTATITIPILQDFAINGGTGFFVVIGNPTGGAILGPDVISAVIVANTDRDFIAPSVTGLVAIPDGPSINGFVIFFSEPLDPSRATLADNYQVFVSNRDSGGRGETRVALAAANYDPATNSVTLVPSRPLAGNRFYHLVVNGSFGPALTDTTGNALAGSGSSGSNYDVFFGQGNDLRYLDSQGNAVAIRLTGGGTMSIFRGQSGDVAALNLLNVVPRRSRLTGTVRKLGRSSSGRTTINSIAGLGRFGDVTSNLTTPPFYVLSAPVTFTGINGPTTVSAAAVASPSVVAGRKTPKGPGSR